MRAELSNAGLAFERFPAVLGVAVPDWLKSRFFEADGTPVQCLKPGEIGVYASHLVLHRHLLERDDLDALVIMEDDLRIAPDFANIVTSIAQISEDFDIIRLSNPAKAPFITHGYVGDCRHLVTYSRVPNNMGCYLISKSGAKKTTRHIGVSRFAIDEDMRRPWRWGLETFGVLPAPVDANIFEKSSIDALGKRALGAESTWQKLRRRQIGSPKDWLAQIRWQIRHLGARNYLSCLYFRVSRSILTYFDRVLKYRAPHHFIGRKIL